MMLILLLNDNLEDDGHLIEAVLTPRIVLLLVQLRNRNIECSLSFAVLSLNLMRAAGADGLDNILSPVQCKMKSCEGAYAVYRIELLSITSQALSFFRVIKSFFECQKECVTKQSMTCLSRNVCGLAMPPNSEVILSVKMCAIANGMGTDGLRRLCMCTAAAGARQLAAICPRIVLS
ncbi:unnamed protein product [Heligmosomoides polygyrus]|uniref:WAPL domain-containing protein n=1 Tax=Heligmosomoides polygyrus TaxID=6339 RepID=A0A183F3V1_HELPZ|nr:unnamed protein product [Heligmosomoides polygyrus]